MEEIKLQTCSEVYCLLNYFPKGYIDKLPKKLLDLIKQNSNSKYFIEVDTTKPLEEQNISEETKNTLIVFKYNYWSGESEKQRIIKQLKENEKKYQETLREKYNPDNIFSKKQNNIIKPENNQTQLIEYKQSIFRKILDRIKEFFKM